MTKQNKGRKLFAVSASAALVASAIVPVASAAAFTDQDKIASWATEYVDYVVENGYMKGNEDGTFAPTGTFTRAQAAQVIVNYLGLDTEDTEAAFSDVKKGAWYYGAVNAVAAEGLVNGVGGGNFAPEKPLTRQDAAKLFGEVLGLDAESADLSSLDQFNDADKIADYAAGYIALFVDAEVINGKGEGFDPTGLITRQELAKIVALAIQAFGEGEEDEVAAALAALAQAKADLEEFGEITEENYEEAQALLDALNEAIAALEELDLEDNEEALEALEEAQTLADETAATIEELTGEDEPTLEEQLAAATADLVAAATAAAAITTVDASNVEAAQEALDTLNAALEALNALVEENEIELDEEQATQLATAEALAAALAAKVEAAQETPPTEDTVKVESVSAITATTVTVAIDAPAEDLVDQTVVVKDAAGKEYAVNAATIKAGAKTATFTFVTPLTVNPTDAWTVNGVAYKTAELSIAGVEGVDKQGKYINVQFNQKVTALDPSEITVRNKATQKAYGVESVKLSADGYSALVTLIGNDSQNSILDPGVRYTLSITKGSKVTSGEFVIPAVRENATVTAVDVQNRTITLDKGTPSTITVPASVAFDFNEALGRDITVWLNEKNQVDRFVYVEETVAYDAVVIVVENGKKYVKTVNGNKTYEIDATVELDRYVNASGVATTVAAQVHGTEIESAKVVIGDNGKVQSIIANNYSGGSILVEKVTDTFVSSYNSQINLKDFQIVKDGKTISVADLKEGDVVFYHSTSGTQKFAEVFTNKVSGAISNFYDGEFKLNGTVYKYNGSKILVDGKWETVTDSIIKPFTKTVHAYTNREGKLELITGEVGEVTTLTTLGFVTKGAQGYKVGTKETIEFATTSAAGTEEAHVVDVSKLQTVVVNGVLYTTSKLTSAQAANANNIGEIQSFSFNGTPSGAANTGEVLAFTAKNATSKSVLLTDAATKLGYSLTHKTVAGELGNLIGPDAVVEVTKDAAGNVIGLNIKDVVKDASLTAANDPTKASNYETVAQNLTATVKTSDTLIKAGAKELKITADTPVFIEADKLAADPTTKESVEATTFGKLPINTIDVSKGSQVKIYADAKDPNKVAYVVIEKAALGGDTTNITKTEGILKTVRFADNKLVEAVFVVKGEEKVFTKFEGATAVLTQANIGQNFLIDINNSVEGQLDNAGVDTNALAPIAFTTPVQAEAVINLNENAIKLGSTNYKLESDAAVYEVKVVNGEKVITKLNGLSELTSKFGTGKVLTVSTIAQNNTYVDTVVVSDAPAASFNYTAISGTVGTALASAVAPSVTLNGGSVVSYSATATNGLTFNGSNGEISGTPTTAGTNSFVVTLNYTDAAGVARTATTTVNVTIAKGAQAQATGTGGTGEITGLDNTKAYQISADGGTTWTTATVDASGKITGLTAGTYVIRFAETSDYNAGTASTSITVS